MNLTSLTKVLHDQLKDLRSAESQLVEALPRMAKRAHSPALKKALTEHLGETEGQLKRLEGIGESIGLKLGGQRCKGMEGLLEEGKEVLESDADGVLGDLAMIAAAQRVEHYEIAAYGTARELAAQLGHNEVAALLQKSLDEEGAADKKLTDIAFALYPEAPHEAESATKG